MEGLFILAIIIAILIVIFTRSPSGSSRGGYRRSGRTSTRPRIKTNATEKGEQGEAWVKRVIGSTDEAAGRCVINNLVIKLDSGATSQIDHVLINHFGVFVIETKNYSGMIIGSEKELEWTQVLNYGKTKNRFYNPLKQNATHIYHISKLLPKGTPIRSVIVFVGGDISKLKVPNVYRLSELKKTINTPQGKQLTDTQIVEYYNLLMNSDQSSVVTNKEHIGNVERMRSNIENRICPRCQGKLVERKGAYGSFLGCENYPKCKFTMKLTTKLTATPKPAPAVSPTPVTAASPAPAPAVSPTPVTAASPAPAPAVSPTPVTAASPAPAPAVSTSPVTVTAPATEPAVAPEPMPTIGEERIVDEKDRKELEDIPTETNADTPAEPIDDNQAQTNTDTPAQAGDDSPIEASEDTSLEENAVSSDSDTPEHMSDNDET